MFPEFSRANAASTTAPTSRSKIKIHKNLLRRWLTG
jgi:hypothetical protein